MTKLEALLSGLLVLILLGVSSYLIVFYDGRSSGPTPVAASPARQSELLRSKQESGIRPNSVAPTAAGASTPANQGGQVVIARNANSSGESDVREEDDVAIPVAFVSPPSELTIDEEQFMEFDMMRQQFVELMGGPDQDPGTPEYRQRWQYAQELLDEEFMAFFGLEAFNKQQLRAVHQTGQTSDRL